MSHREKKAISAATVASTVALCTAISACHWNQSAEALMEEARQYQQKGDDKSAIIQLKNAVQKSPENGEARFMLAGAYLDFGDGASAEKEVRKAMSLGIKADRTIEILGHALLQQNQPQKVLDETKALDAKNSTTALTLQGEALLALGRFVEAKGAFDAALKINGNDTKALIGMAHYSFMQHDIDGATRLVETAVGANPGDAEAWLFKGDLLRAENQAEPARRALLQGLPRNFHEKIRCGSSRHQCGQEDYAKQSPGNLHAGASRLQP